MNTLVRPASATPLSIDALRTIAAGPVARTLSTVATWVRRQRSRKQLAELDDAMLRDIGISRANADFEASKAFWRA